jgi:hemerythrin-like domain-containing protein
VKPIGPLMWEHRLIERMVPRLEAEIARLAAGRGVTPGFIEAAVDFFHVYADRTHHGKEEDILFKRLAEKPLSAEHRQTIVELMDEHRQARGFVGELARAREAEAIERAMRGLVALYPRHIEKEDRHFFFPVMEYLTAAEQDAMLTEFYGFDRNMIHEKYRAVVEGLEGET